MGFVLYSSSTRKHVIAVLNCLGITCSYDTVLEALHSTDKGIQVYTDISCENQPFMLTYDNFDIYAQVKDERMHDQNILHCSNIVAVISVRKKDGTP